MKDLLYLKDEQIKEFIQLLYYAYRETFSDLTLEKALTFSDGDFRNYFSGTAIKRLGSDRFLRNVIYAMGNSGKKEYIKFKF